MDAEGTAAPPARRSGPAAGHIEQELRRRMQRPQRHRLLQGYPMAPLMRAAGPRFEPFAALALDPARPLLVGVLPHTFCNPKVKGCGFCTFPHERLSKPRLRSTVAHVVQEIEATARAVPALGARTVEAVYIGGGTANLTPPEQMAELLAALTAAFELRGAELTLEGVPRYFLLHGEALLDLVARAPVRHRRISMGVQTFDPAWLARMGRDELGGRAHVEAAIAAARRRGLTTSADLLCNLPGAPAELALADARAAIELGFDQICVYNLVLTRGLRTEWSRDAGLVAAMPGMRRACATWLAVRELLLAEGYEQTTLTNFERRDVARSERRFAYERASFDPGRVDGVGFGPGGISTFTERGGARALKWINHGASEAYGRALLERRSPVEVTFAYGPEDLRLLHLTRNLSALGIDRARYRACFDTDPVSDFAAYWEVIAGAGLARVTPERIELTPEGMFYADTVAGLLAAERADRLGAELDGAEAHRSFMG